MFGGSVCDLLLIVIFLMAYYKPCLESAQKLVKSIYCGFTYFIGLCYQADWNTLYENATFIPTKPKFVKP